MILLINFHSKINHFHFFLKLHESYEIFYENLILNLESLVIVQYLLLMNHFKGMIFSQ